MTNSYGAIPQDDANPVSAESGASSSSNKCSSPLVMLGITMATIGIIFLAFFADDGNNSAGGAIGEITDSPAEHWPSGLYKMGGVIPVSPRPLPTNTTHAATMGWIRMDEPCNPLLGEEWLYKGERSINASASVYFTPEVGDAAPGVLSAIEVQYYGYVEENLVGTYFSEAKTSKDGPYHTLPVAFRNGEKEDLCDQDTPATPGNDAYIMISPGMANKNVPATEDSPELISDWKEGSCIPGMGYHWATDVETGPNLTYQAKNLVPIVPMYSSTDKSINGIFFTATSRKQTYPLASCGLNPACALPYLNMWDGSPGLTQKNAPRFYMCSNFCGDCQFTGAKDGMFTTMHWFFNPTYVPGTLGGETCGGFRVTPYCRNDKYPELVSP